MPGRRAALRAAAMLGGAAGLGAARGTADLDAARGAAGPDLPGLELAFAAIVTLQPTVEIGRTPLGVRRRVEITGGTFEGPRIRGRILPGGADWQLQRADDVTVIEADYMLQADDGTRIHIRNIGLTNTRVRGAPARYLRTAPVFEAPDGPHEWLNRSLFIGTLAAHPGLASPAVRLGIYRVT